jgi:uncharacterized protein (DUF488 family)
MFMSQIFTIGHSNRQWSEFTRLLEDNHVVAIVDVRRHPGSKSFPQFNREDMAKELLAKNIGYSHIEKLGGRRKGIAKASAAYDNSGWQNKSFRSYAEYMPTTSFKEGIKELLFLMAKRDGPLAIMCSEAVPWRCHRRLIADYLVMVEGISVCNIIGKGCTPSPHKLTSFAVHLADGAIAYPKPQFVSEKAQIKYLFPDLPHHNWIADAIAL